MDYPPYYFPPYYIENEEKILGTQSFFIFLILMISGTISPVLRAIIPTAIDAVSSIMDTIALINQYSQDSQTESNINLADYLVIYYIILIVFYSLAPYYRGAFDTASDILPLPYDTMSMFLPLKYPES